MAEQKQFIDSLKSVLKMRGTTYDQVAVQMGVSQSTVKRWFSTGSMTLDQYSKIMKLAGVSFSDLAKLVESQSESNVHVYNEAQELFLVKHPAAHAFFHLLLQYGSVREVTKRVKLSNSVITKCLRQLDAIDLIEWQSRYRYRLLVPKRIAWRKDGPLRKQLLAEAKGEFLQSNFSGKSSSLRFLNVRLTEKTVTDLISQFSKTANELSHVSEVEKSAYKDLDDFGILMAVRPWLFSKLSI